MPEVLIEFGLPLQANSVWIEDRYVCLSLANKSEFRYPADNNKKLAQATDDELASVELICDGTGLHW